MAMYFLDSSAVVKRYFPEQGHRWIDALCDAAQGHEIYIAQSALVEVVAALCRREREGSITVLATWIIRSKTSPARRRKTVFPCPGYLAHPFLKMRGEQRFSVVLVYNFLKVFASIFNFL